LLEDPSSRARNARGSGVFDLLFVSPEDICTDNYFRDEEDGAKAPSLVDVTLTRS
jgi:hypothetical protein